MRIERGFDTTLCELQASAAHLPSRLRSLIWILCSLPVLAEQGRPIADEWELRRELAARLPQGQWPGTAPQVAIA